MNKRAAGLDTNKIVPYLIFVEFNQMFADEPLLSHRSLGGASTQGGQAGQDEKDEARRAAVIAGVIVVSHVLLRSPMNSETGDRTRFSGTATAFRDTDRDERRPHVIGSPYSIAVKCGILCSEKRALPARWIDGS